MTQDEAVVPMPMGGKEGISEVAHGEERHDLKDAKPLNLGPVVDAAMEQIRHRIAVTHIRSLVSCIGVGEAKPFSMPPQHQMMRRMKANANYFLTNYLLTTAAVFSFLLLFFHPIQLILCMVIGFGWYIVLTRKHGASDEVLIFGRRIPEQHILLLTTISSVTFLVFVILPEILFALSTSSIGCAVHALLRDNRLKDDTYSAVPTKSASSVDEGDELA